MRVKSNFLSKNAKFAFGLIALCGILFTSCYEKDDNLDVNPPIVKPAEATYSLVGDVTNYLGEAVNATATLSGVTNPQTGVSFGFADLQPGSYTLNISASEYQTVTKNIIISPATTGHIITRADVTLAKVVTESVLATYKVQGIVRDQKTGAAIKDATVKYGTEVATTDANGSYTLANVLAAGSHVVTIEVTGYPLFMAEVQLTETYMNEATTINKVFNFAISKADVIVEKYSITATSEDSDVMLVLYKRNEGGDVEVFSGNGSLSYMAEKGTYFILASKEGETIGISKLFTLGEGDSQSFAWSVSKKETGENFTAGDNKPVESSKEDAKANIIPQVGVSIPKDAVEEGVVLNIRNIPTSSVTAPVATASALAFIGTPSGVVFNTPLEFTFTDNFDLGDMTLFYLEGSTWVPAEDKYKDIKSENGVYTAKIPHFSQFQFGFNVDASSLAGSFDAVTGEGSFINNTGSSKKVTASYKIFKGAIFTEDIATTLSTVTSEAAGIELVKAIITDLVRYQYGVAPSDRFSEETVTKEIEIPAGEALKAASATQEKTFQSYRVQFTKVANPIEIKVEVAGSSVLSHTLGSIGHGHGNEWNAGGGISVAE